ncbi:MAG TPA: phosphatase domain-containing protein [Microbacteriaceae bacterium]|nr:phosphatase domain-containing protein [Microbacteriaceae bacterium]
MPATDRLHRAARFEDVVHRWRERGARRRGKLPTVVAFTGYGTERSVRILARVLFVRDEPHAARVRGWRSFVSVPISNARVTVRIGETETALVADRGGVIDAMVDVSLRPGWHTATFITEDGPESTAPVVVVGDGVTTGVISDVDDTVMVTMLPRPLLAAWNTFVLNEHARIPTAGMAVLYEKLLAKHAGAPVVYLSTGAWNVAPTLRRFLSRNLFPAGPLLLTDWGPTHDRWFRSGKAHKEENLRRLAVEFPNIRWILVGDDGQHDIDLYSYFAAEFPDHVRAIVIREMTGGEAVLAGGRAGHDADAPVPVVFGPDGATLSGKLSELGVL